MGFIWLADSLYATAPFISMIQEHKEEYIFRVKKGDHKHLYECLETAPYQSHKSVTGTTTIAYRWYENIALNKSSPITVTVIKAGSEYAEVKHSNFLSYAASHGEPKARASSPW